MHQHTVVWSYDGIVYSNENNLQSHMIRWTDTTNNTGSQKQVPIGHIQYDTFIQSSKPGKTKLTCFREAYIDDELSKGTDTIKVRVMTTSKGKGRSYHPRPGGCYRRCFVSLPESWKMGIYFPIIYDITLLFYNHKS